MKVRNVPMVFGSLKVRLTDKAHRNQSNRKPNLTLVRTQLIVPLGIAPNRCGSLSE